MYWMCFLRSGIYVHDRLLYIPGLEGRLIVWLAELVYKGCSIMTRSPLFFVCVAPCVLTILKRSKHTPINRQEINKEEQ